MKKIFFLFLVFAMLVAFSPVMAQTNDGTDASVPSSLGLWWQGIKESVSLGLTFDPVKKAEKALNYAEYRMQLAEMIASQTNNPKAQEKAEAMIEKAQSFMEKIQAGQTKWLNSDKEERKVMLMKNVANYQEKKEAVLDRIEEGLTEEQKDKFNQLREKGLEINQRLMNALDNENIPEDVRNQLEEIRTRIEAHAEQVKAYIQKREDLRDRIKAGDETAVEELKELNNQRREDMRKQLKNMMENGEQMRQRAEEAGAVIRERIQNRVQDIDTAEMGQRQEEAQVRINESEESE